MKPIKTMSSEEYKRIVSTFPTLEEARARRKAIGRKKVGEA